MLRLKIRNFLIFILGGALNTGVSFAVYWAFNELVGYRLAYLISYLTGIIFSYFFNCFFVFKKETSLKSFFAFPLVYLFNYIIGAICMEGVVGWLHVSSKFAPLMVAVLMLPVSFLLSKSVLNKTAKSR